MLFLIAIIAMIMSTVDSCIFALATMWSTDIIKPFLLKRKYDFKVVSLIKCMIFIIGIVGMIGGMSLTGLRYEMLGYGHMFLSPLWVLSQSLKINRALPAR